MQRLQVAVTCLAITFCTSGCSREVPPSAAPAQTQVIDPDIAELLEHGSAADWKSLPRNKRAVVALWTARRRHPEFKSEMIVDRANRFVATLDRLTEEGTVSDTATIADMLATSEATDFPQTGDTTK